jgi:hypothetical protein
MAFPVGTEISKVFGDGIAYGGQVVSFDPKHKLYAVEYDDGDSEELTEEAVRAAAIDTGAIEIRPGEEESTCRGVNHAGAVQRNRQAAGRKARESREQHESDGPAATVFASLQDPNVQAASRVAAEAAANAKAHVAASVAAEATAAAAAEAAAKVRKTPSWPRSWANFRLLWLYSYRNAWVNLHLLGQPNTHSLSRSRRNCRHGWRWRKPTLPRR